MPTYNSYKHLIDKFKDEVVVCVASGESLTQEDVDYLKGKARVITVNTSFRMAPWADIHYSNDHDWWIKYFQEVSDTCSGEMWTGHPQVEGQLPFLRTIPYDRKGVGLAMRQHEIYWGGNSGFAAIQVAYKTNPRMIGLLGYDMKGTTHWHGEHPEDIKKAFNFPSWIDKLTRLSKDAEKIGLPIVNFTRDSALECFPKMRLEDVL